MAKKKKRKKRPPKTVAEGLKRLKKLGYKPELEAAVVLGVPYRHHSIAGGTAGDEDLIYLPMKTVTGKTKLEAVQKACEEAE